MDWLRWWHGTVTDPKFQWVARKSGQNVASVIAVWACLLECASSVTQCNADETRGDVSAFDCDTSDVALGLDDGASASILSALESKGMVADGRISNWDKRQPKREDPSAARVRKHREAKRSNAPDNDKKRGVTHGNAPERDTDTDKEVRGNPNGLLVASNADDHPTPPAKSPSKLNPPSPNDPVVIAIPLNTGDEFPVTQSRIEELAALYPAVDVPQALRSMRGWCLANPKRRKTKTGAMGFVTAWLSKDQNRGGSPGGKTNGRENFASRDYAAGATPDDELPEFLRSGA